MEFNYEVKILNFIGKTLLFLSLISLSAIRAEITGLLWKQGPIRVVRSVSTGTFVAQFSGYYARPGWHLYISDYEIPLKENGEFLVSVPIDINRFKVTFTARGQTREEETESEIVHVSLNRFFPEINHKKRPKTWLEQQSRNLSMNVGLGSTYVAYKQTDLEAVSETNLTGRVDFAYALDPGVWSFESSAFSSFVSLNNSPLAGSGMHTWGVDGRLGYEMGFGEGTWAAFLFGGFYGIGTFGTDNVGYGGVYGPEFFPALRYNLANGSSFGAFAKYCFILNGVSFLRPDNAYMALGANYYFKPFQTGVLRGVPLGVNFEVSRLRLNVLRGDIITTNYTLGLNLMF